jgi:hypothetical protein
VRQAPSRDGLALIVSPGVVSTPDATLGFRAGLLARDPDGQAVQRRVRERLP